MKERGCSLSHSPLILILLLACASVEGKFQVIGSPEPIVAAPGDDAILPCRVEPPLNVAGLTVEWSRPDLRPDPTDRLSRVHYVHLYRNNREIRDMKISSYVLRTSLFTDDLTRGNISLKIINVTHADGGRYRCFIPRLKSQVPSAVVYLVIEPTSTGIWSTERTQCTKNLQTPDPKEEKDVKGVLSGRSRLIPLICFLLIVVGGVGIYFMSSPTCHFLPARLV